MAGANKRNLLKKGSQPLFKELSCSSWASVEAVGRAQFAPNQNTSWINQSGAAGAQKGSSPQTVLI